MPALKHLFSPITLGTMELDSRLVMPPMSVNFGVDEDGHLTEQHTEYLGKRAAGGTRMITVGGGAVHPTGLDLPRLPRIWDDSFMPGLEKLARAVKLHDTCIGMQLLHGGRQSYQGTKVAPSPLESLGVVRGVPRELTSENIIDLVAAHGDAAKRCQRAGFDFVEIHGAHGYLISEFLAPLSNKRKDEWGGPFENRIRFLLEILRDIKSKVGADYPVGVRLNGDDCIEGGWTLEEAVLLAPLLQEAGVDWLHVSAGIYGSFPVTIPSLYSDFGCFVHLAEAVKKAVSIPVIAVGRIKDPRMADRLIAEGRADLVAMGRAHLADPELSSKSRADRFDEIRPCIGCCRGCIDSVLSLEEATCVMNPSLGREYLLKDESPPDKSQRVLVIGAGPAGLAAARRTALRGHAVTVVEQNTDIGGAIRLAANVPGREEMMDLVNYHRREIEKLNVDIRLDTKIDDALIDEIAWDVVILATGGQPEIPQVAGLFDVEMKLHTVHDVLKNISVGDRIIVLGGGMAGLQTADFLVEQGREVVVLNRGKHFAQEMAPNDRTSLRQRLKRPGARLFKNVIITRFLPDGAVFQCDEQEHTISNFTDIVIAEKMRPKREVVDLLRKRGIEPHIIGDAKKPRENLFAIAEGDEVGRLI
ncbi:MAG: FAD-dependent oxidoreductase [Deltaproteobacteria bacterium]|nr:FAD-dependent oxidoreductase [Deltaproteobacteria bacterium]